MDIKRSILMVALAATAYALVLKWNQDYGQPASPTQNVAITNGNSSLPTVPSASGAVNSDVPSATASNAAQAKTDTPAAVSKEFIRVKTDVLDLAIDPRGGDIVQLSLPKYPRREDQPNVPFQLFDSGNERVYEAQSGLVGTNGPDATVEGRPLYATAQPTYQLADGQDALTVDLTFSKDGVGYTKRFSFKRGEYDLGVSYSIDNKGTKNWSGNLFTQLKRDNSPDPSAASATGTSTYLGAALWTSSKPYTKVSMKDIDKGALQESVQGGWVAWLQHYFVTAWIPTATDANNVYTRKDLNGNYIIGATGPAVTVAAGAHVETGATLYAGPKIQTKLAALSPGLDKTVDYGYLWFIAEPIFWVLQHIHALLGNWGWSIICLTMMIKLIFFPLSAASYKSMARMRAVAPKLALLKEKHGDDRQKMSQSMMELYKKEKINPLGGCLPIVVQMPVFLALYSVLLESVDMRQTPWMFWITDLSSKDPFFILPIIMGATMFLQQQLNPTPPDPMQAKVMKLMPIIFTFFFMFFPAGLVLYWVVNNCLSITQQWFITRRIEAATKNAAA